MGGRRNHASYQHGVQQLPGVDADVVVVNVQRRSDSAIVVFHRHGDKFDRHGVNQSATTTTAEAAEAAENKAGEKNRLEQQQQFDYLIVLCVKALSILLSLLRQRQKVCSLLSDCRRDKSLEKFERHASDSRSNLYICTCFFEVCSQV